MPHQVKGILTVAFSDVSVVSKIDKVIAEQGFDMDFIHCDQSDGIVDFFIDETTSTSQTIDPVLQAIDGLPGVNGVMWINDKHMTEPYWVTYGDNTPKEQCLALAERFFGSQQRLINKALDAVKVVT